VVTGSALTEPFIETFFLRTATSAVFCPPLRSKGFEMSKEFRAAQNIPCYLLCANKIRLRDG